MNNLIIIAIFLKVTAKLVCAKTVQGVLSSKKARLNNGQYITSFCFYGDGFCKYDLSQNSNGKVYFYTEKRWSLASEVPSCQEKLSMAEFSFQLTNTSGDHTFVPWEMIDYWHVVYADLTTCDNSVAPLDDISFTIQFLNKDHLGKASHHFSYEEMGLLSLYKLITFVYFIAGSLYGQRLWQTISKGGPMHQVIKELSIGVTYHALASLFMLTNHLWYAKDGIENRYLIFIVIAFQSLAEFKMLGMTLKVSFGWMIGSSKSMLDGVLLKRINFAVGILSIIEIVLLLWNYVFLLCICKFLVVGVVVFNIKTKLSAERSSLRKDFYTNVIKSCCLWFLGLPCSTLLTLVLPSYYKLKIITFGQRTAEMVSVLLLYKLFLSRSLYWEVSSLSSATLPLRLDKAFGKKNYCK